VATTSGNGDCHVILRGGKLPNYDAASIDAACAAIGKAGLPAQVMIDVSHANSGKQPENQPRVIEDLAARIATGETRILGVMVESHLLGGRQELQPGQPLRYGQSITDGCIDWESSVQVLRRLAQAVRQRRGAAEPVRPAEAVA
jgi:3-deoxy-7-phosphoheptulonate synthase